MNEIDIKNLSVKYGSFKILKDVSFKVQSGQWLMLVGPNGAGKTTITNALSRNTDYTGLITLNGKNIQNYKSREYARKIGFLEQNHYVNYDFTVREIVELGRYAYENVDDKIIDDALEMTGLLNRAQQKVTALSGGELQRTFLAQLLTQNSDIFVLDEPTNHLDIQYQNDIFEILQKWLKISDHMIISVVHDLSLAKKYGTHAALIDRGQLICFDEINSVLTPDNLAKTYNIDVYGWMNKLYMQWST